MSFLCARVPWEYHTTFSCYVSLGSSRLWQFLRLSLLLLTLTMLRRVLGRYFVECPSIWVCLIFFSRLDWGYGFVWKITKVRCYSHHSIIKNTRVQRYMPSRWLNTADVDLLAQVVTVRFLHCTHEKEVTVHVPYFRGRELRSTSWREQ